MCIVHSSSSFLAVSSPSWFTIDHIIMKFSCSDLLAVIALSVSTQDDMFVLAQKVKSYKAQVKSYKAPRAKKSNKSSAAPVASPSAEPVASPSAAPVACPPPPPGGETCIANVSIFLTHWRAVNAMKSRSHYSVVSWIRKYLLFTVSNCKYIGTMVSFIKRLIMTPLNDYLVFPFTFIKVYSWLSHIWVLRTRTISRKLLSCNL